MKEFYLLPKHQFEILTSKKDPIVNIDTKKEPIVNMDKPPKELLPERIKNCSSKIGLCKPNKKNIKSQVSQFKTKNFKVPQPGQQWQTRMLPPPLQKNINMKGMRHDKNYEVKKNPNIQHHLAMKLYGKDLSHARLLLNHLEKSGDVEWNEYGDILHPL